MECAELMNKFPIEESLLRRGSVRRFCGCGNDEQNKQKARAGAAYMDQMDLWLMKLREMTAGKYNVKRSTLV